MWQLLLLAPRAAYERRQRSIIQLCDQSQEYIELDSPRCLQTMVVSVGLPPMIVIGATTCTATELSNITNVLKHVIQDYG